MPLVALEIGHRNIVKLTTIPGLQRSIHTKIEQTVTVLYHRIDIVTRECLRSFYFTSEHLKLIAVIAVDTIAGGNPKIPLTVLINLSHETTGQLSVWVEKFSQLGSTSQCETAVNNSQYCFKSHRFR